jgi:type VI secretion system protein ImpA
MSESSSQESTPAVVDVEALLAPIEGENPVGPNLQYEGLHDELREARRAEDTLEQGDWVREPKAADWEQVESTAIEALKSRTKDLQVCSWLSEALVKRHGFVGLRDSLAVMRGLHERFWENVWPEIDEGDLEARANALAWMDRTLADAIKGVPITKSSGGESYTFLDWGDAQRFNIPTNLDEMSAEERAKFDELRATAEEENKVTGEKFRTAKFATSRKFYEEVFRTLNECWTEFQSLDRVMDEKFVRETPGLGALKKSLEGIRDTVEKIVKEKRELEPDPISPGEAGEEGLSEAGTGGASGMSSGPVRSRQEALNRLSEVAEYFRRSEPHSPVAYLVQRAIDWGHMPLDLWLENVIKDPGVLASLRDTLGLRSSEG